MYPAQNSKPFLSVVPQSITGAATTLKIDTQTASGSAQSAVKFNYLVLDIVCGSMANAWSSLKLTESDDDSTYRDITATYAATTTVASGSTGANRLPQTSDASSIAKRYFIKLDGTRQRYIKPEFNTGAGASLVAVVANLWEGSQIPNNDTERNVKASYTI